jgi:biotin carboxylase
MELSLQIDTDTTAAAARPGRRRILVGFAEALAAIESAWSLLDAGFEVVAFARHGSRTPLRRSGSVELHELTPPELGSAAAVAELRALIATTAVDAVMPLDDVALRLCAEACRGTGVVLVGPIGRQAEVALDKRLQIEAARAAGLAVPPTAFLGGAPIPENLEFPLVVRPAAAIAETAGRLTSVVSSTAAWRRGATAKCSWLSRSCGV